MTILYLNNQGTRWRYRKQTCNQFMIDGDENLHTADCFKQFGNYVSIVFRYKGKRYDLLPFESAIIANDEGQLLRVPVVKIT